MNREELDRAFPGYMEPLSGEEKTILGFCERIVDQGLTTYILVGWALKTIHDFCLWRQKAMTWKQYCQEEWAMSSNYANRLIAAAKTAAEMFPAYFPDGIIQIDPNEPGAISLGPFDPVIAAKLIEAGHDAFPRDERQIRALKKVPVKHRDQVWAEARKESQNGQPTVQQILERGVKVTVDEHVPCEGGNGSSAYRDLRESECTDFIGQMVPDNLRPVFKEGVEEFKAMRLEFRAIKDRLEGIMKTVAGARLNPGEVKEFIRFMKDFSSYSPHAVCPGCHGDPEAMKKCRGCFFTGWLSRCVYRQLPIARRTALEMRAEGAEVLDDDI